MKKQYQISFLAILFISCAFTLALAGGHGHKTSKKVGILLVAFGSSKPSAQVSFENIDQKVKAVYPGVPVRWAYTSHMIRKKLAKQGKHLDSPAVALAKMQDEGSVLRREAQQAPLQARYVGSVFRRYIQDQVLGAR